MAEALKEKMSLNGVWQARFTDFQRGRTVHAERDQADSARYLDVNVPGEIHLDLMRHGLIQDIYESRNVLAARWVEEQIWSYRRMFDAPAAAIAPGVRAWLCFDCLDLAADVVLNGEKLASHANSFLPLRVEVTGKLRDSSNVLAVHVESGLWHVAEKPVHAWHHRNARDQVLHKRHWLRKPQNQFSWDWAPRLINVGIQGSVTLEFTRASFRLDRFVPLASVDPDLSGGSVRGRFFIESFAGFAFEATLRLSIDGTPATTESKVLIKPGQNVVEASVRINSPQLWWPRGAGDQAMYTVSASVEIEGHTEQAEAKRVGFRQLRINEATHVDGGSYFHFVVNGRPVFCKGANLVPADLVTSAIDTTRIDQLVGLALEANFNLLRVWGGGLYEADHFYDRCDESGIMVWQDFIFACARYPIIDEHFQKTVIEEATHQIRRLAHHPSLFVWCGSNENEVMHWAWGAGEHGVIAPDYSLYHLTLPRILNAEHPDVLYRPSSPYSGPAIHPDNDLTGDQHPWSVGFANTDFRDYREMVCRFANEGGILGPTSLKTMLRCLGEGQRSVQSFDWQVHDNSIDSWEEPSSIDQQTLQWLGLDCRKMSIEQYVFWGGLIQGEGLRAYIDNFRRRMFNSGAAVFWMYNDCWPATRSWSIVDHSLRRTPGFHPVRRAFAPVSVVIVKEGDHVICFGVNDTGSDVECTLRFGLVTTSGEYVQDQALPVRLAANSSAPIARFDRRQWADPTQQIAFAVLRDSAGGLIARNRLILPLFKEMKWAKSELTVSAGLKTAIFQSPVFVFNVCIDLNGDALSDNFFDVFPNEPYSIPWTGSEVPIAIYTGNSMCAEPNLSRVKD